MKRLLCLSLTILTALTFSLTSYSQIGAATADTPTTATTTQRLKEVLSEADDSKAFEVSLWITDIDQEQLQAKAEKTVKEQSESLRTCTAAEQARALRNAKLQHAKTEYLNNNGRFADTVLKEYKNVEIVFQSSIAPMFIIKANKQTLLDLSNNPLVTFIDYHENMICINEGNVANANSGVNYLANTSSLSATGQGIKIGMIESGVPYLNKKCNGVSVFNTNKVHIVGNFPVWDDPTEETLDRNHATKVAAIMVGQAVTYNGTTYKGIVPQAELYCISSKGDNFFSNTEYLIGTHNVDIINISYGISYYWGDTNYENELYSYYDNYCKWIDFIINVYGVHVTKSAGNNGDIYGNEYVTSPGLAYNAITVGNYYDSNSLLSSHAPSTLAGQELSSDFAMYYTSSFLGFITEQTTPGDNTERIQIYKPDIVAMGQDYEYGDLEDMDGTSFAAPQVAGMIAQLCDIYPYLLDNPLLVKAMLMSGASYLANIAASGDVKDYASGLYLKQGAGMANVRCAYTNYYAGRIKEFSKNFTAGSSYSFTINVPSSYSYIKMAMCWNKTGVETIPHNVTERPHANLRLSVYKGTNTSVLPVATSDTMYTNSELLQFAVTQGGTYTVVVTRMDSGASITHDVAISWY